MNRFEKIEMRKIRRSDNYNCRGFAEQWLIDNPENVLENVPKFGDMIQATLDGDVVYIALVDDIRENYFYSYEGEEFFWKSISKFKLYIETQLMEIPLNKVNAVKELIK